MRPAIFVVMLLAASTIATLGLPAASAHICDGPQSECGNCDKGEEHAHGDGDSEAGCMSDGSEVFDSGYNKKGLPFLAPVAIVGALLVAALLLRRD